MRETNTPISAPLIQASTSKQVCTSMEGNRRASRHSLPQFRPSTAADAGTSLRGPDIWRRAMRSVLFVPVVLAVAAGAASAQTAAPQKPQETVTVVGQRPTDAEMVAK